MHSAEVLEDLIFQTENPVERYALDVFAFQYRENAVYREFCDHLGRTPGAVKSVRHIPFLPVELFKTHRVSAFPAKKAPLTFRSSGTTGQIPSQHHVQVPALYEKAYREGFHRFYGDPKDYRILALLPGYLERSDSSLVHMVAGLIADSGHPDGGFFLDDIDRLRALLQKPESRTTLLIGVSFALLDLAESTPLSLQNTVVMETGGMKGRRREITRAELHERLKSGLGVDTVHSEYGMTELLSQAYAKNAGRFATPPWMQLQIRDVNDPLSPSPEGRSGAINVVDLANLYSCSFIATSDLGRTLADGTVEVLGRTDFSDVRGCNLMVSDL
ncbi:MAG: acyl transferase [Flavobacteriales bacterium]|nr:acyl transferase [Flavobacteriales bacterium]